jgi:hypothetical protein
MDARELRRMVRATGLHPHQCPPLDEPWRTWLLLGGRGSGKTFAGAWNHFLDNLPPEGDVKRKIEALQLTKVDDNTSLLHLQQEVLQVAEAAGFEPGATNDWQPPKVTPRKATR